MLALAMLLEEYNQSVFSVFLAFSGADNVPRLYTWGTSFYIDMYRPRAVSLYCII